MGMRLASRRECENTAHDFAMKFMRNMLAARTKPYLQNLAKERGIDFNSRDDKLTLVTKIVDSATMSEMAIHKEECTRSKQVKVTFGLGLWR